jgi:tetratricopeptide (TPR) repeat protein
MSGNSASAWAVAVCTTLVALGCSATRTVPLQHPDLSVALARADSSLAAGCFDCLREALAQYQAARNVSAAAAAAVGRATAGAVQSAALLALRQRELGMVDDGYLETAKGLVPSISCTRAVAECDRVARLLEVIGLLPIDIPGVVSRPPETDAQVAERFRFFRNREQWSSTLRDGAGQDLLSAYVWLALACGSPGNTTRTEATAPTAPFENVPLVAFKRASCLSNQPDELRGLESRDPRFVEVEYPLALSALGRLQTDEADAALTRAYAWHPRWPAVTLSLANLATAAEDFERALAFYDTTLVLDDRSAEAMLGRVRALTYLGRYKPAIAATDQLLPGRLYLGDTRYWRAFDEFQLGRLDEAWNDIEESNKLLINALVPKLAGLIASARQQRDVARVRFEESVRRNADDCETGFYLGLTLADLGSWDRSAETLIGAVRCFEGAERSVRAEIGRIRESSDAPERQARLIASRERQIAAARRMMAQATFNTAVAYLNLSRDAEARPFAERVANDEQFGQRARELLARFK